MLDLEMRLQAALDLKSHDGATAILLLNQLVSDYPTEVWPLIHLGVALRDAGDPTGAAVFLLRAIAIEPTLLSGYIEAAFTLEKLGSIAEAEEVYRNGVRHHPRSSELRAALASLLRRAGRHVEALSILAEPHEEAQADFLLLEKVFVDWELAREGPSRGEFLEPVFSLPLAKVSTYWNESVYHKRISRDWLQSASGAYVFDHIEDDSFLISTTEVEAQLWSAISNGRPFSLIRMADGEGAFFSYMCAINDPMCAPHVKVHGSVLGSEIWNTWLGRDIRTEEHSELSRLANDVRHAVQNADIVGVPRIADTRCSITYIEYHGCAKAHAIARELRSHGLCVCQINVLLLKTGFYAKLLSKLSHLTIMTCHSNLKQRLEGTFSNLDVRIIEIPLQVSHASLFKYDRKADHFPNVYKRIIEELNLRVPGEVFLVSAGIFGKAYAGAIKSIGGIAIDVGAVSDALAGFDTRASIHDVIRDMMDA